MAITKKIQIALRLSNRDSRVRDYGRLPEDNKEGLRAIAKMERKSMSRIKEEVIIDYFKLERPIYVGDDRKSRKRKVANRSVR